MNKEKEEIVLKILEHFKSVHKMIQGTMDADLETINTLLLEDNNNSSLDEIGEFSRELYKKCVPLLLEVQRHTRKYIDVGKKRNDNITPIR